MFTAAELAEHRADAEELMTLTLTWYAPGADTMDGDLKVPGFDTKGTSPGKVQSRSRQGDPQTRTVQVGGTDRLILEGGLHIPLTAFVDATAGLTIRAGWEGVVTALDEDLDDPALLGRRYLVVEIPPAKSRATARHLNVVEV